MIDEKALALKTLIDNDQDTSVCINAALQVAQAVDAFLSEASLAFRTVHERTYCSYAVHLLKHFHVALDTVTVGAIKALMHTGIQPPLDPSGDSPWIEIYTLACNLS